MIKKQTMYLIFDSDRVFRLCCPNETIATEMKKEGETTMEVKSFQTPMMPVLTKDDSDQDEVVWVPRVEFSSIKFPPPETEEKEEEDVPMADD